MQQRIANENFYQQDHVAVNQTLAELKDTEGALEKAFKRWSELDSNDFA